MKWWNDKSIKVVEIEKRFFALDGWNGEHWYNCWECSPIDSENGTFYYIVDSDVSHTIKQSELGVYELWTR